MKRKGNLYDDVISFDNLLLASYKAFKGKNNKDVLIFRNNFLENILSLHLFLKNGEVELGNYREFTIYEPKKRLICAAPLQQRVIHHAIMNVCHSIFDKKLIFDSYASRPEKGTHKAILRVSNKCKNYKFFAKLDVRKFFDSVDHDILKSLLRKMFKDIRLLNLFDGIIDSYGNNKGLPIGNLTSQYFANHYLSYADHYMKEDVKTPVYIRYMDDVIIMSNEKDNLKELVKHYSKYLETKLNLRLKPPIIGKTIKGIPFLGYVIYHNRILMNGKGKRRYRRNIRLLTELHNVGKISEVEYSNRLKSCLAYAKFADSFEFRLKYLG